MISNVIVMSYIGKGRGFREYLIRGVNLIGVGLRKGDFEYMII